MGPTLVLKTLALAVWLLLLAACVDNMSITTAGSLDPESATTISDDVDAPTTPSAAETTTIGPPEETTTSTPLVTSFEAIAGTYEAMNPGGIGFFRILDDGTLHWASEEDSPEIVLNARFQGTRVLITDPDCGQTVEGIYEFHLPETGDLEVVLIQDACPGRASLIPGEYTPVE